MSQNNEQIQFNQEGLVQPVLDSKKQKKKLSKKAKKIIMWSCIGGVIGAAVIVAATVGGLYGANPMSSYNYTVAPSSAIASASDNYTKNPYNTLLSTTLVDSNESSTTAVLDSTSQTSNGENSQYYTALAEWKNTWDNLSTSEKVQTFVNTMQAYSDWVTYGLNTLAEQQEKSGDTTYTNYTMSASQKFSNIKYNTSKQTFSFEETISTDVKESADFPADSSEGTQNNGEISYSFEATENFYNISVSPQIQTLSNQLLPSSSGFFDYVYSNGLEYMDAGSYGAYGSLEITSMTLNTAWPFAPKISASYTATGNISKQSSSTEAQALSNASTNYNIINEYISELLKEYPQDFNLIAMIPNSTSSGTSFGYLYNSNVFSFGNGYGFGNGSYFPSFMQYETPDYIKILSSIDPAFKSAIQQISSTENSTSYETYNG